MVFYCQTSIINFAYMAIMSKLIQRIDMLSQILKVLHHFYTSFLHNLNGALFQRSAFLFHNNAVEYFQREKKE